MGMSCPLQFEKFSVLLCLRSLGSTTSSMTCICRHSDVAWAITTAIGSQPQMDFAQKDKVSAALVQPINALSGRQLPLTADSQPQSLLSHTASPLLQHSR